MQMHGLPLTCVHTLPPPTLPSPPTQGRAFPGSLVYDDVTLDVPVVHEEGRGDAGGGYALVRRPVTALHRLHKHLRAGAAH